MALALVAHVVVGEPAQLFVDDRHEPISRDRIAVGPIGQDLGYALALGGIGVVGHRFRLSGHSSAPSVSPEPSQERLLGQGRSAHWRNPMTNPTVWKAATVRVDRVDTRSDQSRGHDHLGDGECLEKL